LLIELRALRHLAIDDEVEALALEAHRKLAQTGHHRLPPVDILVAALAERHSVGVCTTTALRLDQKQDDARIR
jgi:predicted nucleic acid-binding protein